MSLHDKHYPKESEAIQEETAWSSAFLEALSEAAADTDSHEAVNDMMKAISSHRSRKQAAGT